MAQVVEKRFSKKIFRLQRHAKDFYCKHVSLDGTIIEPREDATEVFKNLTLYDDIRSDRKYYIGGCFPHAVILDAHTGNQLGFFKYNAEMFKTVNNAVNFASYMAIIGRWLNGAMVGIVRDQMGLQILYHLLTIGYQSIYINPLCQNRTPESFGVDVSKDSMKLLTSNVGIIYSAQRDRNKFQLYDLAMLKQMSEFQTGPDGTILGKDEYFRLALALIAAVWIYSVFENIAARTATMGVMEQITERMIYDQEQSEAVIYG